MKILLLSLALLTSPAALAAGPSPSELRWIDLSHRWSFELLDCRLKAEFFGEHCVGSASFTVVSKDASEVDQALLDRLSEKQDEFASCLDEAITSSSRSMCFDNYARACIEADLADPAMKLSCSVEFDLAGTTDEPVLRLEQPEHLDRSRIEQWGLL